MSIRIHCIVDILVACTDFQTHIFWLWGRKYHIIISESKHILLLKECVWVWLLAAQKAINRPGWRKGKFALFHMPANGMGAGGGGDSIILVVLDTVNLQFQSPFVPFL